MSSVLLDARNEGLQHPILSGDPVATRSIGRDDAETDGQTDHSPLELLMCPTILSNLSRHRHLRSSF
jgi:hypothetical protein